MARKHLVTQAVRALRAAGVEYREYHYDYVPGAGAGGGAEQLALDPHVVIKTLILETPGREPLCVLMHGDREVSLKGLARELGIKAVSLALPDTAERYSGYQVGGTSPFGMRTAMPIYCERSITELAEVVINGGRRGFLIGVATADLLRVLEPTIVRVAI